MIQIDKIFQGFPILESENLILQLPEIEYAKELYLLLEEPDIKSNYLHPKQKISSIEDIYEFIIAVHENFRNKQAITWIIIEKNSQKLIGMRDLYFDNQYVPVEGQGCITASSRRKGYASECYNLIFEYFKSFGVTKYSAKTNGNYLAPIKMMYNLGFRTTDISFIHSGIFNQRQSSYLLTFLKDLDEEDIEIHQLLGKHVGKKINFFVSAFFRPYEISIQEISGMFQISFKAFYPSHNIHRQFQFGYDRKFIFDLKTGNYFALILDDNVMKLYEYFIENLSTIIHPIQ